jgi:GT2 family glycosyltransferase
MAADCDIVLLVYDKLELTRPCLESILAHTPGPFRLTIVDNGSTQPQTLEYLASMQKRFPEYIRIARNEQNQGYIKAVNKGLSLSDRPFICVISNDTLVFPGWLSEMLSAARQSPAVGLVNPQWEFPARFGGRLDIWAARLRKRYAGQSAETDWARGFCFLVRREVINAIGGLDEAFSPGYFDDWDFAVRAVKKGYICTVALAAFVRHYINATFGPQLGKQGMNRLFEERRQMFLRKWGRPLRICQVADHGSSSQTAAVETALALLRDQNRLVLITDDPAIGIRHTNCVVKRGPGWMLWIKLAANLLNNLRYQKTKRYDMIICSRQMMNLMCALPWLRREFLFVVPETGGAQAQGFWRLIKQLKQKTA